MGRMRRRRFWKKIELGPVAAYRCSDQQTSLYRLLRSDKRMILERFPQMDTEKTKNVLPEKRQACLETRFLKLLRNLRK